jgi:hypothetical protein
MSRKNALAVLLLILLINMMPVYAQTAEDWKLKGNDFLKVKEYDKSS